MTEDMIREQEELFENLGSSEDATKIRAQLQSVQLKSGKLHIFTYIYIYILFFII